MNGSLESNTTPDNVRTAVPSTGKKHKNPVKGGLTQGEVREHLDYDPETGELRWRKRKKSKRQSLVAGSSRPDGYRVIGINYTQYLSHRLIWLWWYGYFPEHDVDHINRDKTDNRLTNLREVAHVCNIRNCKKRKTNSSGVTGIRWDTTLNKWTSTMMLAGKHKYLGGHDCFTEAVAHRLAAEQCLDWAGCDNNSPAYQYMKNYVRR